MNGVEALRSLITILNREEIPYMVVGSFSSNYHGVPRSTKDADLVLEFNQENWGSLVKNLPSELVMDEQGSFEMVTATRKEVLKVEGSAFEIELFHLSGDEFDEKRFARREKVVLPDIGDTWLATAEDVVVQKLRWAVGGKRLKDFDDVVNVFRRKQRRLDFDYIESWCGKHGTLEVLAEARAEAEV